MYVFAGLEELVFSEISSPSRTQQTGDSSSISSFSYREIMKEGPSAPSTNKVEPPTGDQRPLQILSPQLMLLFLWFPGAFPSRSY